MRHLDAGQIWATRLFQVSLEGACAFRPGPYTAYLSGLLLFRARTSSPGPLGDPKDLSSSGMPISHEPEQHGDNFRFGYDSRTGPLRYKIAV